MSTQLDILALEPFFGGARKAMLETIFPAQWDPKLGIHVT